MTTPVGANNHCHAEDSGEDLFPFADKADANAAAKQLADHVKWLAEYAEAESRRPLSLVTGALTSFAKTTLEPHTTDSTTRAALIVDKVMKTPVMETPEEEK